MIFYITLNPDTLKAWFACADPDFFRYMIASKRNPLSHNHLEMGVCPFLVHVLINY